MRFYYLLPRRGAVGDRVRPRTVSGDSSSQPLKSEKADPAEEHAPTRCQPGFFRPGNAICGGARAKGLNTGLAHSARRAR